MIAFILECDSCGKKVTVNNYSEPKPDDAGNALLDKKYIWDGKGLICKECLSGKVYKRIMSNKG